MGQWIRESEASETEFSKLRGKLLNETSDSIVDRGESCRSPSELESEKSFESVDIIT